MPDPTPVTFSPHTTITAPTFAPALQPTVHTPVTVFLAVVLCSLTVFMLYRIVLVCIKGPRTLSNFNVALFFTFCWGSLRSALIIVYAVEKHVAANITALEYQLLFIAPVCLQYASLSLVFLDFCQGARDHVYQPRPRLLMLLRGICVLTTCAYVIVNVVYSMQIYDSKGKPDMTLIEERVIITECLTIFLCVMIAVSVFMMRKTMLGNWKASWPIYVFTALIVCLFLSKAFYNMATIVNKDVQVWGYRFTFLSDRFDRSEDNGLPYVFFVVALFIWEIVPVLLVVWLFWARLRARHAGVSSTRAVHFDAAKMQDDDDDDDSAVHSSLLPRRDTDLPILAESPDMHTPSSSPFIKHYHTIEQRRTAHGSINDSA